MAQAVPFGLHHDHYGEARATPAVTAVNYHYSRPFYAAADAPVPAAVDAGVSAAAETADAAAEDSVVDNPAAGTAVAGTAAAIPLAKCSVPPPLFRCRPQPLPPSPPPVVPHSPLQSDGAHTPFALHFLPSSASSHAMAPGTIHSSRSWRIGTVADEVASTNPPQLFCRNCWTNRPSRGSSSLLDAAMAGITGSPRPPHSRLLDRLAIISLPWPTASESPHSPLLVHRHPYLFAR